VYGDQLEAEKGKGKGTEGQEDGSALDTYL
jgi:hypothetical protein